MKNINAIRSFICFNQKELIQYEFLLSEKHKELRLALEKDISKDDIDKLLDELISLAYSNLLNIYNNNIDLINKILCDSNINDNPVISIKTIEEGKVLDFYHSKNDNVLKISSIKSYSGFSEIMNSSEIKYYISNDLEKSFLEGKYKHPKLDKNSLEELKNNKLKWKDCWKDNNLPYLSELIIPMAIRINENDDPLFKDKFSNKIAHGETNRTVWAFLCFEYLERNAFINENENNIVDTVYIIADVLSLYLMFFYNHISGSKTFQMAIKKLISEEK